MSGKCRASLRAKTLENVKRSLLSQADKNCIAEVFARFEKAHSEIDRLTKVEKSHQELNGELRKEVERLTINMNAFGLGMKRESERADTAKAEAIKEVFAKLKKAKTPCIAKNGFIVDVVLWDELLELAKEMGVEL